MAFCWLVDAVHVFPTSYTLDFKYKHVFSDGLRAVAVLVQQQHSRITEEEAVENSL